MKQKISSGSIVIKDQRILLVHHMKAGEFDFWVAPGGGVNPGESIFEGAKRETFEETGLTVRPEKILYIQEFVENGKHVLKTWVLSEIIEGTITLENMEEDEDFLIEAGFFSKEEVSKMNVYPEILKSEFWQDLKSGFKECRYLGFEVFHENRIS